MKLNSRRLDRRISLVDAKLRRISRNAINDTAFELRRGTPGYLTRAIDKPVAYTRGIGVSRVDKASSSGPPSSIKAVLRVSPAQAKYLAIQEHGGVKEDGAVATGSKGRDSFGNVKRVFHRSTASVARLEASKTAGGMAKYFIGRPLHDGRGGERDAGIYERSGKGKKSKIRMISSFVKRVRYKPQLGLRAHWNKEGQPLLKANVSKQRRIPANRI